MDTTSLLEFLIVALCRYLEIKPNKAVDLMSHGNKKLSEIIVNGIKKDFEKI
jgi:hypothetical protein